MKRMSVLHQNSGGIGKSILNVHEISRDPRDYLRAKPEGNLQGCFCGARVQWCQPVRGGFFERQGDIIRKANINLTQLKCCGRHWSGWKLVQFQYFQWLSGGFFWRSPSLLCWIIIKPDFLTFYTCLVLLKDKINVTVGFRREVRAFFEWVFANRSWDIVDRSRLLFTKRIVFAGLGERL